MALFSTWAQTIEVLGFDVDGLKLGAANDGVYWGKGFEREEPPSMEERCGMMEVRSRL